MGLVVISSLVCGRDDIYHGSHSARPSVVADRVAVNDKMAQLAQPKGDRKYCGRRPGEGLQCGMYLPNHLLAQRATSIGWRTGWSISPPQAGPSASGTAPGAARETFLKVTINGSVIQLSMTLERHDNRAQTTRTGLRTAINMSSKSTSPLLVPTVSS